MIGAQLQEIETHPNGLALGLYKKGRIWWIIDLSPQFPVSLFFNEESPWKHKVSPKPVALFLNSHVKNLYLSKLEQDPEDPRIWHVEWVGAGRLVRMEVRLIPKAPNLIVEAGPKSIAWSKPKGLPPVSQVPPPQDLSTLDEIKTEWLKRQQRPPSGKKDDWQSRRNKDIAKKTKALKEIQEQLASGEMEKWKTLGELLKSFEVHELGSEWKEFTKFSKGRVELMQHAFDKAKQLERKRAGTLERVEILKREVAQLEMQTEPPETWGQNGKPSRQLLKEARAEGRTKKIGDFTASRGKNAKDNLALLRAAKAWDLWVHLQDYPSSHVVIAVAKNQKVPDSIIQQAALWLIQETVRTKTLMSGSSVDVLVAECRYVRPIKGDKLGRVHYQNERVLRVVIP